MAIEKSFHKSPSDVVYVAINHLQKWCIRLKGEDQARFLKEKAAVITWLQGFNPSDVLMSDIREI